MPNHVTTRCLITGPADEIMRFKTEMIGKDKDSTGEWKLLDFNKAIPMPNCLKTAEEGSVAQDGAALVLLRGEAAAPFATGGLYPERIKRIREESGLPSPLKQRIADVAAAYLAKNPEYERQGRQRLANVAATGFASWYSWAVANWGTKWNSYSFEIVHDRRDKLEIMFNTAWSFPEPVFRKIAELFPKLKFDCAAFDEGWGFAAVGAFNGEPAFTHVEPTDTIYEFVYGEAPQRDERAEA